MGKQRQLARTKKDRRAKRARKTSRRTRGGNGEGQQSWRFFKEEPVPAQKGLWAKLGDMFSPSSKPVAPAPLAAGPSDQVVAQLSAQLGFSELDAQMFHSHAQRNGLSDQLYVQKALGFDGTDNAAKFTEEYGNKLQLALKIYRDQGVRAPALMVAMSTYTKSQEKWGQ